MNEKLSVNKIITVSLMLFAMFFGAGNMIFPPMLGQMSGENYLLAVLGFVITDAGLSIVAIAAVVLMGSRLDDLAGIIGPKFSVFLGILVYLLIGPLFALPRTGVVSFEMGVAPFLGNGINVNVATAIFTGIFFIITYFLCLNPSKLVDIVGKFLTPLLLIAIAIIFGVSLINGENSFATPVGEYAEIPFFKGLVEGYLALDGLAALVFAVIVVNAFKTMGIKKKENIAKYTLISGTLAGVGLAITYVALGYVGAHAPADQYANGGALLATVVKQLLGISGSVVLGVAVILACLTTSIGLASSFSNYFNQLFSRISYKTLLKIVCIFSFAISNVGLNLLIKITLPALIMVYPPIITLVVMSFMKKWFKGSKLPYILAMSVALVIGVLDGLKAAGITFTTLSVLVNAIPLFNLGIGWIMPTAIAGIVGFIICRSTQHVVMK